MVKYKTNAGILIPPAAGSLWSRSSNMDADPLEKPTTQGFPSCSHNVALYLDLDWTVVLRSIALKSHDFRERERDVRAE